MRTKLLIFGGVVLVMLTGLGIGAVYGFHYVKNFPKTHPEETLIIEQKVIAFFDTITLPIKIAKLSRLEPDTQVFMPVYNVRVSQINNTWQASRGDERVHDGQDIFAAKGTPVFSGTTGYILRTGVGDLGGNYIFVIGAGGRRYYYAHLNAIADGLNIGQEVTPDTVIGFVGNTGNAVTTPPHLHFGIYERREALNPLPLLTDRPGP